MLEAGELLRSQEPAPGEAEILRGRLNELARHPKWEVRKAVAHAAQFLDGEPVQPALAVLMADPNEWVRSAARRSIARRTELTHTDTLRNEREGAVLGWLEDLERKHGAQARNAALGVGERYTAMMVRDAYHELVKVISPLDASLMSLESKVKKRAPRSKDLGQIAEARERVHLVWEVFRSLRAFTEDVTPEFRSEPMKEVLDQAIALLVDRIGEGKPPVIAKVVMPEPFDLYAHRTRLLQAFGNVLQNAYEAYEGMKVPRRVRVYARLDWAQGRVCVTLRDWGAGMSPEHVRECTQLYTTTKATGTGFGLPLSKKIVEVEHHGSLLVSSRKGHGTTVTIVLPFEQEQRGTP